MGTVAQVDGVEVKPLTVHQRIVRASERGRGMPLSVQDVHDLASDHAIVQCAQNDDEKRDEEKVSPDAK